MKPNIDNIDNNKKNNNDDYERKLFTESALVDKIKHELTLVTINIQKYKEEIKRLREGKPNYYNFSLDLDFSANLKTIEDNRKYYYRAYNYQKVSLAKPVPHFKVSLQDFSLDILRALLQFGPEERKYVIKQAIGRIFEDLNLKLYHDSISSVLKVTLIDGSDYDYVYTEKEYDDNESDLQQREKIIAQILSEQEEEKEEVNDRKTETNIAFDIKGLEDQLKRNIPDKDYFENVVNTVKKTVKCEDSLIRQILYVGLSSYVEDDPLNLGVLAPTSEGKTYAITESLQYFPDDDVMYIGRMSPKVLIRQKGILIDKKSGEPLYDKIQELRTKSRELSKKKRATKDRDEQERLTEEVDKISEDVRKMFEDSKTLIDLSGKILLFLEPPQHELWELLKPILSHDKEEIEFPFVDKTANSNAETKYVVVRGWPACIFCSAKDESKWEIWDEIKSRILVTSPNMVQQKYQESNKLISQTKGLPSLIQQQIIISDKEIETAKSCILIIKQKINELKSNSKNHHKISTWIPYKDLLVNELPANKGTDVRFAKKIFSLLNMVPIVKNDLRMILNMECESSIITDLQDLREVLSITQNSSDGLPKFKAEFYNDIFLPLFKSKTVKDSNDKEGKDRKEEEIIAVKTRELCDYFKEKYGKPITTDNLKKTYLNPLINEGFIDYTESKINGRQNIYYPLVTESLSIESITGPIDKKSQQNTTLYEKIIRNITEGWIFHEIVRLIHYRLGWGNIETTDDILDSDKLILVDYLNDSKRFVICDREKGLLDNNTNNTKEPEESIRRKRLGIDEFIAKYVAISNISIDNKPSNILASFAKRSSSLSILAKIDLIDKK